MTFPLVSVIIPCYKQAQYLPEAVESVLGQTYPHVEVIVVNDGSPDDTEAVAKRYGDRIRYVWRPNGGISAARNTGIAHSSGSYLKFLDSDDYLHPEQIAWQMEALAGREDAVSFTGCRLFRDGHPDQYLDHIPQAKNLLPDLFRGDIDWGSILCYLFPRRLVEKVGGFVERVHYAEDWFFACQVGLDNPELKLDPRIGCYYRQRRLGQRQPLRLGPLPGLADDPVARCPLRPQSARLVWTRAAGVRAGSLSRTGQPACGRPPAAGRHAATPEGIAETAGDLRGVRLAFPADGSGAGLRPRGTTASVPGPPAEDPPTRDPRHGLVETGMMAGPGERRGVSPPVGTPTVSVIVPAYRASGTIGRALDSLLAQTCLPDEIVVVDDGSPDDLASAVARFGDRVRLLRKPNGGAASARNFGIDHSTGELIAFLDADDCWAATKLDRQLAVLSRHPEVGLVAGDFLLEQPGACSHQAANHVPPSLANRVLRLVGTEAFRVTAHIWTSTVLVRRSVLGEERFDTSLRTAEDIDLWVRLVLKAPIYLISECLATMVLLEGSLSRSDAASDYPNMLRVIQRHAALLGPAGVRAEEARTYRMWAASHLSAGEARKALRPAWRRLMRQPWSLQAWWIVVKSAAWSCTPGGSRRHPQQMKEPASLV